MHAMYSNPGKPLVIAVDKEQSGISCEFIIATMSDSGSSESSSVPTRWNTQSRQTSVQRQSSVQTKPSAQTQNSAHREDSMAVDDEDGNVSWGVEREMSPARSSRPREEEEDLYGEPMQTEEDDEEIPPTQQERYQGIFET